MIKCTHDIVTLHNFQQIQYGVFLKQEINGIIEVSLNCWSCSRICFMNITHYIIVIMR